MECLEIVFKAIELGISCLAVVLVVFGWIIPYRQSQELEKRRKEEADRAEKLRWKKEYVDRQISEFYGPLAAIIHESDISFGLILFQLGRKCIFESGKELQDLPEKEQKIWMHYVDTYKLPAQAKMVEIIRNHIELIYHSEIPECVYVFLEYCIGWDLLDSQKKNGVPNYYAYHYSYNYPKKFNDYICNTLELLLKEQKELCSFEDII
ncbi:MAG: hypothetical protein IKP74_05205 [Clostridia bacterium]|nr:hypothetical protein [Clostridia bacterium]